MSFHEPFFFCTTEGSCPETPQQAPSCALCDNSCSKGHWENETLTVFRPQGRSWARGKAGGCNKQLTPVLVSVSGPDRLL